MNAGCPGAAENKKLLVEEKEVSVGYLNEQDLRHTNLTRKKECMWLNAVAY